MNSFYRIKLILITAFFLAMWGCQKEDEFSVVPEIEYISFTKLPENGIDYRGVIKFSFKDKDGDIGLSPNDTIPPYDYNLFITYLEKVEGEFVEYQFPDTTIPTHGRIPYLTPSGQNKTIKGTIEDTIFLFDFDTTKLYDTFKFELYIVDRALHKSNTITTPEILVKKK